ncbi:MAG: Phage SPO1 DNA polymerase-related protein [Parcubacteria group bacterium GW2011_GWC2_49_9]|nr:MAG: Phage SPO1 DNA polymerase-related protein [Parcubacteria group bacterium GW2011_GWC2_49_9]
MQYREKAALTLNYFSSAKDRAKKKTNRAALLLSTINLTRKDVFITNVVKCRPPGNRDPEPNEVDTCTELYLYKQIAIIKPKLIITLGRHSMYRFLPETFKISQVHGKPFRRKEQVYLPLYHPAAALYNGGMRQTLIDDFKRIPKVLEKV